MEVVVTLDLHQFYKTLMDGGIPCEFSSASFPYRELPTCLNQKQEHMFINGKEDGDRWDRKKIRLYWCEKKLSIVLLTLKNNTLMCLNVL